MREPYQTRIREYTPIKGEAYFKIEELNCGEWWCFILRRFESFGAAVVYIRACELRQIKQIKTVSQF